VQCQRHALRERGSHQKSAHKSGTAGVSNSVEVPLRYTGRHHCIVNDMEDIFLMSAGGKFGHNATVFLMDILRRNDIIEYLAVPNNRSRSFITRRLNSKDHRLHTTRK
jgi:hypothetical protein